MTLAAFRDDEATVEVWPSNGWFMQIQLVRNTIYSHSDDGDDGDDDRPNSAATVPIAMTVLMKRKLVIFPPP